MPPPPPPPPATPPRPPTMPIAISEGELEHPTCHKDCPQSIDDPKVLSDSYRSVHNKYYNWNHNSPNYFNQKCDDRSPAPMYNHYNVYSAHWYRFAGDAGDRMPTKAVGGNRCGGNYAGWLATPHPPVGAAPRYSTVCWQYQDNPSSGMCASRTEIKVCACKFDGKTTTFMYKLPRPSGCNRNYCGTTGPMPPPPPPPPASPPLIARPPLSSPPPSPGIQGFCDSTCPQTLRESVPLVDYWRSVHNKRQSYSSAHPNYYEIKSDYYCNNNYETPVCNYHSLTQAIWVRFVGAAGFRMPSEAPGYERCGSHYPGWMSTPHAPLGGHRRKARLCWQTSSGSGCGWTQDIETCTCSYDGGDTSTYLYRIWRPPSSSATFCGTDEPFQSPPPVPPSVPHITTPSPPPASAMCHAECPQHLGESIALRDPWRSINNVYNSWNVKPPNSYKYMCDQRSSDGPMASHYSVEQAHWYRFEGEAGYRMPTNPPRRSGNVRCGTNQQGWLMTPQPARGTPPQDGIVCFQSGTSNFCSSNLKVQTCLCSYDDGKSEVYLYRLPRPPSCDQAFCGTHLRPEEEQSIRPPPSPSPPSYPPRPPARPPAAARGFCHAGCPQHLGESLVLNEWWRNEKVPYDSRLYGAQCDYYSPQPMHNLYESSAKWFRFEGAAGVHMPTRSKGQRWCGTDRPGWLQTGHPERGDGPRASKVCFHYSSYPCYWSQNIETCVCSYDGGKTDTYLYKLYRPPTTCLAFCGTDDPTHLSLPAPPGPPPSPPSSPPPPRPPPSSPPPPRPPPSSPPPPRGSDTVCHLTCPNPFSVNVLTESWRSTNYRYSYEYSSYLCDRSSPQPMAGHSMSNAQWYKFGAGMTRMPESPPAWKRCGTERPGWLTEPMPPLGAPAVRARVCFVYSSYKCYWTTEVQVCTCSTDGGATSIYLYKLPQPAGCNAAYCGTTG